MLEVEAGIDGIADEVATGTVGIQIDTRVAVKIGIKISGVDGVEVKRES